MSWLEELRLDGIAGVGESAGYLDRMIAGGDRSQRQFMSPGAKRTKSALQNKDRKRKQYNSDRKPFQSQSPVVNVDDASWLAERRRKFPKVTGESTNSDTDTSVTRPKPIDQTEVSSTQLLVIEQEAPTFQTTQDESKRENTSKKGYPQRKKTLFEKLIEMDQQSN